MTPRIPVTAVRFDPGARHDQRVWRLGGGKVTSLCHSSMIRALLKHSCLLFYHKVALCWRRSELAGYSARLAKTLLRPWKLGSHYARIVLSQGKLYIIESLHHYRSGCKPDPPASTTVLAYNLRPSC